MEKIKSPYLFGMVFPKRQIAVGVVIPKISAVEVDEVDLTLTLIYGEHKTSLGMEDKDELYEAWKFVAGTIDDYYGGKHGTST